MERQLMNISFGYPETLQATGAALLITDNVAAGWVFCALGLLGIAFRFGIKVQEQEKKKQESEILIAKMAEAGKVVLGAISSVANSERNELH